MGWKTGWSSEKTVPIVVLVTDCLQDQRVLTFMLYRLVGFTPGRCGRGVGRGGTSSLRFCCEASPDVEVAGVVDVLDDATADESKVDEDLRRDTPLLCPFA